MTTITNSKLTDERVSNATLIRLIQWADQHNSHYVAAALCELQERRKADNQEPAGYHVIRECGKVGCSVATLEEAEKTRDFWNKKWTIRPYFYSAQPAPERERIRREHAEWSDATFGNVGPVGPLKLEWADMQFLLWDAQRRMGTSDEFITRAMIEKLEINKSRQWPEPKDGEPRLHIKEQPAPVVPPAIEPDYEVIKGILPTANPDEYACCIAADMWNACRAAMLQGAEPVSQTYNLPELIEGMEVSIDVSTCDADAGNRYFGTVTEVSELYTAKNGYILLVQDAEPNFDVNGNSPVIPEDLRRAAMLQGKFRDLSQPVDPQVTKYEQIMLQAGWVMVPVEPTEEMIAAAMECEDVLFNNDGSFCVQFREIYCAMVDVAPKPETMNG
ncbi:TPA: dATP/dGTP pyrophosphohydrolase domain-containing protein [Salmonella enterica subsp. enterica serovar Birkenhead]